MMITGCHSSSSSSGFYVEGLQEYTVADAKEVLSLINMGLDRRAMAPTTMNNTSSRWHEEESCWHCGGKC